MYPLGNRQNKQICTHYIVKYELCTHYRKCDILIVKVGDYMPVSEAQQKAVNKYLRNTFDDIKTRVPKGKREEYKTRAKELGYNSFNNFVVMAIEEKIEREEKA